MKIGKNLKRLRNNKNMTQKELADLLFVSSQAISRWEHDEVEPDISTLTKLSEIFNVSVDEIINGTFEDDESKENKSNEPPQLVGTCHHCGKQIYSNDDYVVDSKEDRRLNHGGHHINLPGYTHYYCENCKQYKPSPVTPSSAASTPTHGSYRRGKTHLFTTKRLGFGIFFGVAALISTMIIFFVVLKLNPAASILLPILIGYAVFSTTYCLFTDCMVPEFFIDIATFSVKMPGVIVSFDADGLKALIIFKIAIAILSVMVGVGLVCLALALSMLVSLFVFPFVINKPAFKL